jgi:hypothetical protein
MIFFKGTTSSSDRVGGTGFSREQAWSFSSPLERAWGTGLLYTDAERENNSEMNFEGQDLANGWRGWRIPQGKCRVQLSERKIL